MSINIREGRAAQAAHSPESMTTAEAIVAIVDAEAVIFIEPDGTITADRPIPTAAGRALTSNPQIAVEFASGFIFPSPERLIDIAAKSAPKPLTEEWTQARFMQWIIDRAINEIGELKRTEGGFIYSPTQNSNTDVDQFKGLSLAERLEYARREQCAY